MTLTLYNTFTRRKEPFRPLEPDHVRMYVCGPTVYDHAHIGNARPVLVFDVLARLLRRLYPRLTYVRNITDVDDKINARAQESGRPIRDITEETTAAFHQDMAGLGALAPDVEPRATDHVPQMIAMIERLIADGHAYAAEGHVLFNVPSWNDYGALSRRNRDELIAGARVDVAPYKQDPADFVLWKPSVPELPGWNSPWGRGRPGWHIECSAMSLAHLGETFDIHGGGIDLVFPHHENEIAQSRCANHTDLMARVWMHNGYLMVEGEKMSKSLGNFIVVHDLLKQWPGETIRLNMLNTHYRAPLNWTADGLGQAQGVLDRFYGALRRVAGRDGGGGPCPAPVPEPTMAALGDDLNMALAISHLHELAGALNRTEDPSEQAALKGRLLAGGEILGLLGQDPEAWFRWRPAAAAALDEGAVQALIDQRQAARKARDFAASDRIRDDLKAQGVVLEDSAEGTTWRRG